jgi:hypothetical protein
VENYFPQRFPLGRPKSVTMPIQASGNTWIFLSAMNRNDMDRKSRRPLALRLVDEQWREENPPTVGQLTQVLANDREIWIVVCHYHTSEPQKKEVWRWRPSQGWKVMFSPPSTNDCKHLTMGGVNVSDIWIGCGST